MDMVVRRLAGVDLNLLVSLHVLLQFRGVTAAAQHLGITQSTMSHQLARLRELLDDPVLVRQGNAMAPTPRAVAIATGVGRALRELHDVVLAPPAFDPAEAEGELAIALTDWAATEYPPRLRRLFAEKAPRLRLRVVPPLRDTTIDGLDWDVDLAIVSTAQELSPEHARTLAEERFTGVARADHPFCAAPPSPEAFLAAEKLVVHSSIAPSALDAELERRLRLPESAGLRVPYFLAVPPLLRGGDLVAVVPSHIAWGLVVDHGLGAFPVPIALPRYVISVAWSPLRVGDPRILWVAEAVAAIVAEELPQRAARYRVP